MTSAELVYQLETDILTNMIRLLKRGAIGSAQWQAEKLAQLGTLRAMNAQAIKTNLAKAIAEAQKEIATRGRIGAATIDAYAAIAKLQLPAGADAKLNQLLGMFGNQTASEFNRMGSTMLASADKVYVSATEAIEAQVIAGAKTGRQAIAETVSGWSKAGLKAFTDKAGRQWTPEACAQVITRTSTANVRRDAQFQRMDDYGLDLIQISSHADARPGCAPYQGRVYSLNGKTPGYPLLSETTYGELDGIFGINCRHTSTIYTPGQKKTFDPYPLGETEAKYAESQQQRQIERDIRQAKRGLQLAQEAGGDPAEVQYWKDKVSGKQSAMRDFIDESGRTRRRDREQIYK
jgi:hypothetical protein